MKKIAAPLLIVLWLYTAITKLADPDTFRFALDKSNWLRPFTDLFVWLVPVTELALTIGLIIPRTQRLALLSSAIVLSVFTFYLIAVIVSREHLPCACGGVIAQMGWRTHIAFNVVYIAIAAAGYYASRPRPKMLLQ